MGNGVQKINEHIMAPYRSIIITDPSVLAANVPDGTLQINPTLSISPAGEAIKIKKTGGGWTTLSPKNLFATGSITNDLMGVDSVTAANIKASSIQTSHIVDGQIINRLMASNAIGTTNVIDGAVTMTKLSSDVQTKINTRTQISLSTTAPVTPALNDLWIDTTVPTVYR